MIQRHVYEAIIVRHDTGEIIGDIKATATSSEAMLAKANISDICSTAKVTVDDVEYVILNLGSLRPVQEVSTGEVSKF